MVLANPEEVKNRKGQKTDRKNAKHLADLLRHDHIRLATSRRKRRANCVISPVGVCNGCRTARASETVFRNC